MVRRAVSSLVRRKDDLDRGLSAWSIANSTISVIEEGHRDGDVLRGRACVDVELDRAGPGLRSGALARSPAASSVSKRPQRDAHIFLELGIMVAMDHRQCVDPAADRRISGLPSSLLALRPWMLSSEATTWRLFFTR